MSFFIDRFKAYIKILVHHSIPTHLKLKVNHLFFYVLVFSLIFEHTEKIKANLNRENTHEGGELGFKKLFSNTKNSSKGSINIRRES